MKQMLMLLDIYFDFNAPKIYAPNNSILTLNKMILWKRKHEIRFFTSIVYHH